VRLSPRSAPTCVATDARMDRCALQMNNAALTPTTGGQALPLCARAPLVWPASVFHTFRLPCRATRSISPCTCRARSTSPAEENSWRSQTLRRTQTLLVPPHPILPVFCCECGHTRVQIRINTCSQPTSPPPHITPNAPAHAPGWPRRLRHPRRRRPSQMASRVLNVVPVSAFLLPAPETPALRLSKRVLRAPAAALRRCEPTANVAAHD
jgi:hypothetical protein